MIRQVSLTKVLTIDYLAMLGWLFPVITWGLYFLLVFTNRVAAGLSILLIIFILITILSALLLFWRMHIFYTVFGDGQETNATINNITFFRDRGRVDYVYNFQGQRYAAYNAVQKVKQTRALNIGDMVVVLVDPGNPKRAFIRDLYMKA